MSEVGRRPNARRRDAEGWMLRFHLTVMAKQEGRQWSAWCPELEVAAQGDPMQDAVEPFTIPSTSTSGR
jgi:hypothetical protein